MTAKVSIEQISAEVVALRIALRAVILAALDLTTQVTKSGESIADLQRVANEACHSQLKAELFNPETAERQMAAASAVIDNLFSGARMQGPSTVE